MKRAVGGLIVAAVLTACSGSGKTGPGHLQVMAAQSLSGVFPALKAAFEADHKGVTVDAEFAGTSTLVQQAEQHAPGDVFVSADGPNMTTLRTHKLLSGATRIIARNRLVIVVPKGNPARITDLADLLAPGRRIALCADGVPCGTYARQAFAKAHLALPAASEEANVAGVVAKVRTGEADGGIAYVTDVVSGGNGLAGVDIPDALNVIAVYPAAVLAGTTHASLAADFLTFLRSAGARRILDQHGFLAP